MKYKLAMTVHAPSSTPPARSLTAHAPGPPALADAADPMTTTPP